MSKAVVPLKSNSFIHQRMSNFCKSREETSVIGCEPTKLTKFSKICGNREVMNFLRLCWIRCYARSGNNMAKIVHFLLQETTLPWFECESSLPQSMQYLLQVDLYYLQRFWSKPECHQYKQSRIFHSEQFASNVEMLLGHYIIQMAYE